jgi:hypothetical protein
MCKQQVITRHLTGQHISTACQYLKPSGTVKAAMVCLGLDASGVLHFYLLMKQQAPHFGKAGNSLPSLFC